MNTFEVKLPSKGLLYPIDSPLHKRKSIDIKYMTADHEEILDNNALIKSGKFIDKLFEISIVDKDVLDNLENMFPGDRSAILFALRVTGFGPKYEVKLKCPQCGKTSNVTFDLNKLESIGYASSDDIIDPVINTFSLTATDHIDYKILNNKEENMIDEQAERLEKLTGKSSATKLRLKELILSVNDNEDKAKISEYVETMPIGTIRKLKKHYNEMAPNIAINKHFKCDNVNCDYEDIIVTPSFDASFFWPE